MAVPCWPVVAPVDVTSLPSATSSPIAADQTLPDPTQEGAYRFPKHNRLLCSKDFRFVYDNGKRIATPLFAGFFFCRKDSEGPRIGFTVPRALGNAVIRNRLRRRFREAVRLRLGQLRSDQLNPPWSVVINPRRAAIECPFQELEREISRLFQWCSKQDCVQP